MDDPSSATVSSKYYEPCELSSLMNNSKNCPSLFHLNISSLPFHTEELSTLTSEHNLVFDIFGVSETKLRLNKAPFNSAIIPGYNLEFTATECSSSGTAIYIKKGLNYKLRKDLQIYKSKQLESTFIEVNLKNEKIVIGCIYRHQSMELSEFSSDYLTNLLDTLSSENKTVVLLGDYNADLPKYDQISNISDFYYLIHSFILLPHIFSPTRTTATSATLIDNIFTNNYSSSFVSGNLVNTLLNRHGHVLTTELQYSSLEVDSTEQMFRDFQEIEKNKNIISSLLESVDWVTELHLSHDDVDSSSELFLKKMEKIINFWATFQKVSNKQKKLLNKQTMSN